MLSRGLRSCYSGILLPLLLLAACQKADPEPATIEERDGVTYVTNRGDGLWEGRDEAAIEFELEQIYGADDGSEMMLAGTSSIQVGGDGTLYVLDASDHRLKAFAPDGTLLWSAGREGEAPGEFAQPSGLVLDEEDGLYLANQSGSRMDYWRTDGTFVDSYPIEALEVSFPTPLGMTSDGAMVLSGSLMGSIGRALYLVDVDEWSVLDTFEIDYSDAIDVPDGLGTGFGLRFDGERLWAGHVHRHAVSEYSLEGTLLRRISRELDVDYLHPPGILAENGRRAIMDFSRVAAPVVLADGRFLVRSSGPTNVQDPNTYMRRFMEGEAESLERVVALDLFDADGKLIESRTWKESEGPGIGTPQMIGPDSALYTTKDDPYPQVRRYRVHINESE